MILVDTSIRKLHHLSSNLNYVRKSLLACLYGDVKIGKIFGAHRNFLWMEKFGVRDALKFAFHIDAFKQSSPPAFQDRSFF